MLKCKLEILYKSTLTQERLYAAAQQAADDRDWEEYDGLIDAKMDMSFALMDMKDCIKKQDLDGLKACAKQVRRAMRYGTRFNSDLDMVASSLEAL